MIEVRTCSCTMFQSDQKSDRPNNIFVLDTCTGMFFSVNGTSLKAVVPLERQPRDRWKWNECHKQGFGIWMPSLKTLKILHPVLRGWNEIVQFCEHIVWFSSMQQIPRWNEILSAPSLCQSCAMTYKFANDFWYCTWCTKWSAVELLVMAEVSRLSKPWPLDWNICANEYMVMEYLHEVEKKMSSLDGNFIV